MPEPSLISVRVMPFMVSTITSKMRLPTTTIGHYHTAGSQSSFNSAPKLWYSMFRGLVSVSDDGPSTSISNYLHRIYAKQILY